MLMLPSLGERRMPAPYCLADEGRQGDGLFDRGRHALSGKGSTYPAASPITKIRSAAFHCGDMVNDGVPCHPESVGNWISCDASIWLIAVPRDSVDLTNCGSSARQHSAAPLRPK